MNRQHEDTAKQPLTPDRVMEELQRVLAGKGFADSPRLQQFLRYVVEETLAGRAGRLKGFTIAQE
ncbi:MAG: hypothetical protein U9Q71_00680, partial [Pseudomonadota bacterium]|nr:hypothetical protein [Pseudomonadota bacterium]